VQPFLKWAGGKRWLVRNHPYLFPVKFGKYFEPFLGSGAVFFSILPQYGVLSDTNSSLINCYLAIKNAPQKVLRNLKNFRDKHSDEYYYIARSKKGSSMYYEAARFIYLNRTCFNGIYRENLKGEFNVPRGTKDNILFDTDDFCQISNALNGFDLIAGDFQSTIDKAGQGDFIFIDPPYTVRHNKNGFVKYNQKIFRWGDQLRLRDAVEGARKRGAMCLVTNANHPSIREIYEPLGEFVELPRHSVISGNNASRCLSTELAICVGYSPINQRETTQNIDHQNYQIKKRTHY